MSAPTKPWESGIPGLVTRPSLIRSSRPTVSGLPGPLHSSSSGGQSAVSAPIYRRPSRALESGRFAPPIPSRIGNSTYRQTYGRPTVGYGAGNYGMGSYPTSGGYGGYGSSYGTGYGSYGSQMYGGGAYGINRYPHQPGMSSLESRFIQMAEENSRPAFESIESLVQAFGSVSFMMESTFHAMYSSFRAVLGVAENFGRLRSLFGQVFQTFAVLRLFQWIYRKLLYYLGIRPDNPGREAVWKEATGKLDPKMRRTFWPMAMFLSLVCGGPFLVWRLLKSISNTPPPATDSVVNPHDWVTGSSVSVPLAVALYDFTAARDNELTIKNGQTVWVAPANLQTIDSEWVLVTVDWKDCGLVPCNFLQIIEHRKLVKSKSKQDGTTQIENVGRGTTPQQAAVIAKLEARLAELAQQQQPPLDGQLWAHSKGPLPQPADHQPQPDSNPYPLGWTEEMQHQATAKPEDLGQTQPAAPPPRTEEPFTASS